MLLVLGALLLACPALRAEGERARELRTTLSKVVEDFKGFDDSKTTLMEAMDHIAKVHEFNWRINEQAFASLKEPIKDPESFLIADPKSIRPRSGVRLETILREIIRKVSPEAELVIRGEQIEITTRAALVKEFYPGRRDEVLPPLQVVSIKEVPLSKALEDLTDLGEWSVVLDRNAVGDAAKKPVTADFNNVPLDTAVRLLADMAGLKVVTMDRVLYVTTPGKADPLMREERERNPRPQARPRMPGTKN
jgi:hypothetical protein